MKMMLVILIRKITKMVTEERYKEMMIEDQSFRHVVIVIGITVRKLTVMKKEAGVIEMMIGTEGVGKLMTTDLVIEALVDMMIVIIGSTIAGTEAETMRTITDEGIDRMVSGAIEMTDLKRGIAAVEMKSNTGKGAQKVDVEKIGGTVRETNTQMIGPTRRRGTEIRRNLQ
jgi:hypothetical protein